MTKVFLLSLVLASQGISPPPGPDVGRRIVGWSCVGAGVLLAGISATSLVFEVGYDYGGPRRAGLYLSAVGLGVGVAAFVTGIVLLVIKDPSPLTPTVWLERQGGGVGVRFLF